MALPRNVLICFSLILYLQACSSENDEQVLRQKRAVIRVLRSVKYARLDSVQAQLFFKVKDSVNFKYKIMAINRMLREARLSPTIDNVKAKPSDNSKFTVYSVSFFDTNDNELGFVEVNFLDTNSERAFNMFVTPTKPNRSINNDSLFGKCY
jgi:hypothetical protein